MSITLKNIKISNFRGIERADISLSRINFFVSKNGLGKTSCLAAIARMFPILRAEERVFLDADFRITEDHHALPITIDYSFIFSNADIGNEDLQLTVRAERQNTGDTKSHLNAQITASYTFEKLGSQIAWEKLSELKFKKGKQQIIRNGWAGNRICPIDLDQGNLDRHAATAFREESGAADGFRARMVALIQKTPQKETVEKVHPKLAESILDSFNSAISFDPLVYFHSEAGSHQLTAVRKSNVTTPFDCLSGGEVATINFAMSSEFILENSECDFIIVEEPESCFHPSAQTELIDNLLEKYKDKQFYISTHSPFIFECISSDACIALGKYNNKTVTWENIDRDMFLFGNTSMSEISYFAYNYPTSDYMNQVYGFIQAREGMTTVASMDHFLFSSGIVRDKVWNRDNGSSNPVTLPTFIRNFVHHPENQLNASFTKKELHQAIEVLRALI